MTGAKKDRYGTSKEEDEETGGVRVYLHDFYQLLAWCIAHVEDDAQAECVEHAVIKSLRHVGKLPRKAPDAP